MATVLVTVRVDIILAVTVPAIRVAQEATTTPAVMARADEVIE